MILFQFKSQQYVTFIDIQVLNVRSDIVYSIDPISCRSYVSIVLNQLYLTLLIIVVVGLVAATTL